MMTPTNFYIGVFCFVSFFATIRFVVAIPYESFFGYPFIGEKYTFLEDCDDCSISLQFEEPFPYFGELYHYVTINSNGAISFEKTSHSFTQYIPNAFPLNISKILAVFWADVETNPNVLNQDCGITSYRIINTDEDQALMASISSIIRNFLKLDDFLGSRGLIVTWDHVGEYPSSLPCFDHNSTNTFQLVIITDGSTSVAIYNYANDGIHWTHGGRALAGYNAGDGITSYTIQGSLSEDIKLIDDNPGNTGRPGEWIFRIDEEDLVFADCTGKATLEPRFGHIFGGTPVTVKLDSPCLSRSDHMTCLFNGTTVQANYINSQRAFCASPENFNSTGRVVFEFIAFNSTDGITPKLRVLQHFLIMSHNSVNKVNVASEKSLLLHNEHVNLTWPAKLIPDKDPSSYKVDILMYQVDIKTEKWIPLKLKLSQDNDGFERIKLPSQSINSGPTADPIVFQVSPANTVTPRDKRQIAEQDEQAVKEWSTTFFLTSKDNTESYFENNCKNWFANQDLSKIQSIMEGLPPCPPTAYQAGQPNSGFELEDFFIFDEAFRNFFHENTSACYRQSTFDDNSGNSAGQQCCYDNNGDLTTNPKSGGTLDIVAPSISFIEHMIEDVLPFLYCCKGKVMDNCREYYYQARPSDDGSRYEPPNPACIYGDPHLVTLDGLKYTFNGKGEYILIQTDDNSFTLQGRMEEAMSMNVGTPAGATVFTALVAKQDNSDSVQFQLLDVLRPVVNGEVLYFEDLDEEPFTNVIVKKGENFSYSALFANGANIEVFQESGSRGNLFISTMIVSLPITFKTRTIGLMGNYNDDDMDDLKPQNNEQIVSVNSTLSEIHWNFGVSWIIKDPQNSLFDYSIIDESSWESYHDPDYTPVFEPSFSNPILQEEAEELCHGDPFCLFDIAATGDIMVGVSTFDGGQNLIEIMNASQPVVCVPPCVHGACVATNSCNCDADYRGDACDTLIEARVLETVRISRIISSTQGFVLIWQIQLPTIDGFLLNVFKVDGQNTISLVKQKDVNSPVRAFHVTGLKRGTLYQFEIRAKNGDRYGRATKILRMF